MSYCRSLRRCCGVSGCALASVSAWTLLGQLCRVAAFATCLLQSHTLQAELALAEDFDQIRSAMEKVPPYSAIFTKVLAGCKPAQISGCMCGDFSLLQNEITQQHVCSPCALFSPVQDCTCEEGAGLLSRAHHPAASSMQSISRVEALVGLPLQLAYGEAQALDRVMYEEEVRREALSFEQQFHYGGFCFWVWLTVGCCFCTESA